MENIIIRNLNKEFEGKRVFSGYNDTISLGQAHCFFGPSGCGKTTLLRLILGLEVPESGEMLNLPLKTSAVFQEDRLCDSFTVLENVLLVMKPTNEKRAISLLEELQLKDELHKKVSTLSGGMKRRVALARALAIDYDLIVLDEPFDGLDETTKNIAIELIKKETQGKTLLLVSHNEDDMKKLDAIEHKIGVLI